METSLLVGKMGVGLLTRVNKFALYYEIFDQASIDV